MRHFSRSRKSKPRSTSTRRPLNKGIPSISSTSTSNSTDDSTTQTFAVKLRRQDRKNLDILHATGTDEPTLKSQAEVINEFLNTITNDIVDNKEPVPKDPLQRPALGRAGMYPTKKWIAELKKQGIDPKPRVHYKDLKDSGRHGNKTAPGGKRHLRIMRADSYDNGYCHIMRAHSSDHHVRRTPNGSRGARAREKDMMCTESTDNSDDSCCLSRDARNTSRRKETSRGCTRHSRDGRDDTRNKHFSRRARLIPLFEGEDDEAMPRIRYKYKAKAYAALSKVRKLSKSMLRCKTRRR